MDMISFMTISNGNSIGKQFHPCNATEEFYNNDAITHETTISLSIDDEQKEKLTFYHEIINETKLANLFVNDFIKVRRNDEDANKTLFDLEVKCIRFSEWFEKIEKKDVAERFKFLLAMIFYMKKDKKKAITTLEQIKKIFTRDRTKSRFALLLEHNYSVLLIKDRNPKGLNLIWDLYTKHFQKHIFEFAYQNSQGKDEREDYHILKNNSRVEQIMSYDDINPMTLIAIKSILDICEQEVLFDKDELFPSRQSFDMNPRLLGTQKQSANNAEKEKISKDDSYNIKLFLENNLNKEAVDYYNNYIHLWSRKLDPRKSDPLDCFGLSIPLSKYDHDEILASIDRKIESNVEDFYSFYNDIKQAVEREDFERMRQNLFELIKKFENTFSKEEYSAYVINRLRNVTEDINNKIIKNLRDKQLTAFNRIEQWINQRRSDNTALEIEKNLMDLFCESNLSFKIETNGLMSDFENKDLRQKDSRDSVYKRLICWTKCQYQHSCFIDIFDNGIAKLLENYGASSSDDIMHHFQISIKRWGVDTVQGDNTWSKAPPEYREWSKKVYSLILFEFYCRRLLLEMKTHSFNLREPHENEHIINFLVESFLNFEFNKKTNTNANKDEDVNEKNNADIDANMKEDTEKDKEDPLSDSTIPSQDTKEDAELLYPLPKIAGLMNCVENYKTKIIEILNQNDKTSGDVVKLLIEKGQEDIVSSINSIGSIGSYIAKKQSDFKEKAEKLLDFSDEIFYPNQEFVDYLKKCLKEIKVKHNISALGTYETKEMLHIEAKVIALGAWFEMNKMILSSSSEINYSKLQQIEEQFEKAHKIHKTPNSIYGLAVIYVLRKPFAKRVKDNLLKTFLDDSFREIKTLEDLNQKVPERDIESGEQKSEHISIKDIGSYKDNITYERLSAFKKIVDQLS